MTAARITLLTQPDCAFCDHAKQLLRRLAREYPLAVEEIDLATPAGRALAERAGVLFAPGLLMDGQPVSYGRPSERRLRRALEPRAGAKAARPS